jgi:hypothetical protein
LLVTADEPVTYVGNFKGAEIKQIYMIWNKFLQPKKLRYSRAMAGKRYRRGPAAFDSCKPLFREFKILTVCCLYILESAKFVRKYPEKLSENTDHPDTFRQIRNATHKENDLFVKTCRNTSFVQNPLVMLARIWNHLPDSIKTIESDKLLSKKLKLLLLKYAFYDMHEFFSCKFDDVF